MTDLDVLFAHSMERFQARVEKITPTQWSDPTPCDEWDVRALVNHVTYEQLWAPHLLEGLTIDQVGDRYEGDVLGVNPVESCRSAMRRSVACFQVTKLDTIVHLSFGDVPCRVYLTQMLTDAEVHGWDLATATGQEPAVDREVAAVLLPEMQAQEELIRSSGVFGDPVEVDEDADDATKLLALLGRRP